MPFPTRISEQDPDLTDHQKGVANAARRFLRQIQEENAQAEREERNEYRRFYRWATQAMANNPIAMRTLNEMEQAHPWLTEPDEPLRRVVPL